MSLVEKWPHWMSVAEVLGHVFASDTNGQMPARECGGRKTRSLDEYFRIIVIVCDEKDLRRCRSQRRVDETIDRIVCHICYTKVGGHQCTIYRCLYPLGLICVSKVQVAFILIDIVNRLACCLIGIFIYRRA